MLLPNPEFAWHRLSWEEGDGAQRSQSPAPGLRGGVWDPLSPSCACAGNRMSTGIAAGLLWESSELWQQTQSSKSTGSCSATGWESPSKGQTQEQGEERAAHLVLLFLTLSSCSSSRPPSCPSCTIPAGMLSLPPPPARRTGLGFCCCFFAASSFAFPFFPFFPLSSLLEPADCGDTEGQGWGLEPPQPRGRHSSPPAAS